MNPLVSVIIPTYNYGGFIGEAVRSVLAQTYDNLEVIIIDDGSTDDTGKVLAPFLEQYRDKVSCFFQENAGPGEARNRGISKAKGSYIAFLDADDIWFSDKLARQMAVFSSSPEVGFVHTEYILFDDDKEYKNYRFGVRDPARFSGDIFTVLLRENIINGSTIVVKKECLERAGGYDRSYLSEDYILWLRLARMFRAGFISQPLIRCRKHQGNRRDPEEVYAHVRRVIGRVLDEFPEIKDEPENMRSLDYREAKIDYEIGYGFFLNKDFRAARQRFAASMKRQMTLRSCKYYLMTCLGPAAVSFLQKMMSAGRGTLRKGEEA